MQNFYAEIEKNKDSKELGDIIVKSTYDEILKNSKPKDEVFIFLCNTLDELGLLNKINMKSVILGFKKATTKEKEEELLQLLYEAEKLRKEIAIAGRELRDESFESLKALENDILNSDAAKKETLMSAINEALVDATILTDIIKEVSQNVFVSIIESSEDVKEVAYEFSKNLAHKSIMEEEFKQSRVLEISKTIVSQALDVAGISQIYAYDLILGAIRGVEDGIIKSVEKFKDEFKFAPDEIAVKFVEIEKELDRLDEEFVLILKNLALNAQDPVKTTLNEILKKEYDNYMVRMKKLSSDTVAQLREKLSDMELGAKFEDIKKEITSKGAKFIDDFELNQKFENIKKELEESKFFSRFKHKNSAEKKASTKEVSHRAFTASKDIVNENKENKE